VVDEPGVLRRVPEDPVPDVREGGVSGKFDPWNWALFTQMFEVYKEDSLGNTHHQAEELLDLVSLALEYVEVLGYDPLSVFSHRLEKIAKDDRVIKKIFKKYADAYHKVQREMKDWPNKQ
jgi:hypothetical protein